jgi:hypothetical protein
VRASFVTRRPVPAAFVTTEVPFTTLDDLLGYLAGSDGQAADA